MAIDPHNFPLPHIAGDDFRWTFDFVNEPTGAAEDVSGWAFAAALDPQTGSSVACAVTYPTVSRVQIEALAAALGDFAAGGAHGWRLVRGDENRTVFQGPVPVDAPRAVAP